MAKEYRLLVRDKTGLAIMLLMPLVLVIVITGVQHHTYQLVNRAHVGVLVLNHDSGSLSRELVKTLKQMNLFRVEYTEVQPDAIHIQDAMRSHDAMVAMVIRQGFSDLLRLKLNHQSQTALEAFGLPAANARDSLKTPVAVDLFFHPVLEANYRQSVSGALNYVVSLSQNKWMIQTMYTQLNPSALPDSLGNQIMSSGIVLKEQTYANQPENGIPNATQHNIPAWTLFAMFFMVISLGGNMVKEKLSGTFLRLKLLPVSYFWGLVAKQIIYLILVFALVGIIFAVGMFVFPLISLPALTLPQNLTALILTVGVCGLCAISYAMCIGVFANTQEQCNGFGAISVVIMAALGGVFVPAFAMPPSFIPVMKSTPFYWGLQAFYGILLENRPIKDIAINLLPLLAAVVVLQTTTLAGLRIKNLI